LTDLIAVYIRESKLLAVLETCI